jgi:hypothetical protein
VVGIGNVIRARARGIRFEAEHGARGQAVAVIRLPVPHPTGQPGERRPAKSSRRTQKYRVNGAGADEGRRLPASVVWGSADGKPETSPHEMGVSRWGPIITTVDVIGSDLVEGTRPCSVQPHLCPGLPGWNSGTDDRGTFVDVGSDADGPGAE